MDNHLRLDEILEHCSKLGFALRQVACLNQKEMTRTQGINAYGENSLTIDLMLDELCVNFFSDIPYISEIYSEESGITRLDRGRYKVIIDPLDGTKNYDMNISYYSCVIAILNEVNEVVGSYVVNLSNGHEYKAIKGGGASRLGSRIMTKGNKPIRACDGIIVGLSKDEGELNVLKDLMSKLNSYRALGCASLDLCCLAAGKADIFMDLSNTAKVVDVLASSLILEEAGGVVTDLYGNAITSFIHGDVSLEEAIFDGQFRTLAASNIELHRVLMEMSQPVFEMGTPQ